MVHATITVNLWQGRGCPLPRAPHTGEGPATLVCCWVSWLSEATKKHRDATSEM